VHPPWADFVAAVKDTVLANVQWVSEALLLRAPASNAPVPS